MVRSFVRVFVCLPDSFIHSFTTSSSRFCYSVSCFSYNSLIFLMCAIRSELRTMRKRTEITSARVKDTHTLAHMPHPLRILTNLCGKKFPCWLHTVLQLNRCHASFLHSSFCSFLLAVLIKRKSSSSNVTSRLTNEQTNKQKYANYTFTQNWTEFFCLRIHCNFSLYHTPICVCSVFWSMW